jgi:hypothetical protein
MKFLALPSEEKIKLRSQPFDAKKACWIPDPKESFIAADIESTKDDQVTVKTCKGEVCRFILTRRNKNSNAISIISCFFLFIIDKNSEKG